MNNEGLFLRITQNDELRCFFNSSLDLDTLLDHFYHAASPYEALMQLKGNVPVELEDYHINDLHGQPTCNINMDEDFITRSTGNGAHYTINEVSKMPFGAALVLLHNHGAVPSLSMSDNEVFEYEDMDNLYGNRDPEMKQRGFVIYANGEQFDSYLDYLKSTGNYADIFSYKVMDTQYIAFDTRGRDNIKEFLQQKVQSKRNEADRFEAAVNSALESEDPIKKRCVESFEIIAAARVNESTEIVVGKRTTSFGTDYATWQCSNGDNYFWGHYDFVNEKDALADMYDRASAEVRGHTPAKESELDRLRAESNIFFSVVNIDDCVEFFAGKYIDDISIDNEEEFQQYAEENPDGAIKVVADYYSWGDKLGEEAKPATPEQLRIITNSWDAESKNATLIGSKEFVLINEDEEDEDCDMDMD